MKKKFMNMALVLFVALGVAASYPESAAATLTVRANHDHMKVDYNYHGSTVGVSGLADPGVDVVVTISSKDTHQTLKEKNKVAGILWMNTGDITFDHVPNVYYLRSTRGVEDILSAEELVKNGIGYQALLERADIESTKGAFKKKRAFDEFVKYKEANRLYSVLAGGFELSEQDGEQNYHVLIDWPYQIPPGEYQVVARAVKDGRVVERAATKVTVERVGVVKRLADMAQENGALYGAVAIAIALGAGFGVGLIFRKGGGAH